MVKKIGLIKGRHVLPYDVRDYIFETTIPDDYITDDEWLHRRAKTALNGLDVGTNVEIYVTGLTQALIATLNACRERGIKVALVHYDRATRGWWKQEVL